MSLTHLLQSWTRSPTIDKQPLIVASNTPVTEVITRMSQHRASCALVVENERLIGIFTERDVVKITAANLKLENVAIQEVMTPDPIAISAFQEQGIFSILHLLRKHRIRHLPILDESGRAIGVITPRGIREVLKPADLLKFKPVDRVMTTSVLQDSPTASLMQVTQKMAEHRKSCVAIAQTRNEGDVIPIGIITERDIVQFRTMGLDFAATPAQAVMSAPLIPVRTSDSLWTAHELMKKHRIRRLVVVDDAGRLAGIITQSTILEALDPIEMYATIEVLQQEVAERTTQLSQANARLQQEIAQRQQEIQDRAELEAQLLEQNTQLQKALLSAEAANKVKSSFLMNLSHELRTPLHAILGFTQLMKHDMALSPKHRGYVDIIKRSGERLLKSIDNLIELSKIEAERVKFDEESYLPTSDDADSIETEAIALTPEAFAALPPTWLADFRQAIIEGDLDWMLTLIAQIHSSNPLFAHTLTFMANNLQFEELLALMPPEAD